MVDDRIVASPLTGLWSRTKELGAVAAKWVAYSRQRRRNAQAYRTLLEQDDALLDDMATTRREVMLKLKHNRWSIGTTERRDV